MRPRFILELGCSADCVMAALRDAPPASGDDFEARYSERHGVIALPEPDRQFWSTQLGLTVEDAGPGPAGEARPTRVLGIFSPQPQIWTAYVFAIGVLALVAVFGVMCAVVQVTLGYGPSALVASLIAALLGALVYTSTLVGQGLAAGEMYRLRRYLDERLDAAEAQPVEEVPRAVDGVPF